MPKKKRKEFKFEANHAYIAIIALSVVIGGSMFLGDMAKTAKETNVASEIASSPAGKIITDFQEIGKKAQDADEFSKVKEALEDGMGNEQTSGVYAEDTDTGEAVEYHEATFVRAKDGDTYVMQSETGEEITVRLIGVDTPESVAPSAYNKENTEEGKLVSDIVKEKFLEGDTLFLEYDVSPTDKYGRTLAYVYMEDGTMIQDWLLQNGYARTATYPPNVKYADHFSEVQHEAAESKTGLWNGFFEEEGE